MGLPVVKDGVVATLGSVVVSLLQATATRATDTARQSVERARDMDSSESGLSVRQLTANPPQPCQSFVATVSRTGNDSPAHHRTGRRPLMPSDFHGQDDEVVIAGAGVHQRQPLDDGNSFAEEDLVRARGRCAELFRG